MVGLMKKLWLLMAVLLVLFGCRQGEKKVQSGGGDAQQTATGIDVGTRLPDYSAMNLDGSKFELTGKRGKVVLLNVWATWCGPCRVEIPELQRIHDEYASRGFEVVGVSVDESGVESVKQFIAEQKMTYPNVLDPQGNLAALLQSTMLPTSVLLDRNGKIVWKLIGAIPHDDPELKSAIEKAL